MGQRFNLSGLPPDLGPGEYKFSLFVYPRFWVTLPDGRKSEGRSLDGHSSVPANDKLELLPNGALSEVILFGGTLDDRSR